MDFLGEVRKRLDIPPAEREQVMKELEDHYSELREELQADGMSECEAATEAARRLGDPGEIADEIQTVHCRAGWKTAVLAAVPCIFRALHASLPDSLEPNTSLLLNLTILGLVMFPIIREWRSGRRPIWLATWSAFAFTLASASSKGLGRYIYGLFMEKQSSVTNIEQSISVALLSLFSIYLLRGRPRWQLALCLIAAIQMISSFFTKEMGWDYFVAYAYWLFGIPMITALGAFVKEKYGGLMPASIFLFFIWASPMTTDYRSLPICLICMSTIVAFTRGRSLAEKVFSMVLGMMAIDFSALTLTQGGYPLDTPGGRLRAISDVGVVLACQVIYVIIIPMLYGFRKQRRERLDIIS